MASSDMDGDPHRPPTVIEPRTLFPTPSDEPQIEYRRVGISFSSAILIALAAAAAGAAGMWFSQSSTVDQMTRDHNVVVTRLTNERDGLQTQLRGLDDFSKKVSEIQRLLVDINKRDEDTETLIATKRSQGITLPRELRQPLERPEWPTGLVEIQSAGGLDLDLESMRTRLVEHLDDQQSHRDQIFIRQPARSAPSDCPSGDPENCSGR